jgi:hypothetical protein
VAQVVEHLSKLSTAKKKKTLKQIKSHFQH